jgi:glucose dehydrogenase
MAAQSCIECDVAIVGAGFAGALVANVLGNANKKVVILEAGEGVPPNINDYMRRFYTARFKVPESPYTPTIVDSNDELRNPRQVAAGRPTVLSLNPEGGFGDWTDPTQSYLIQAGHFPFSSTYDRVAGGTSHWLGTCLRFVPADFKMKRLYGASVPQFVDWPIEYGDLNKWYGEAEKELGVSANVDEQKLFGIEFPPGYQYQMPKIPASYNDIKVGDALKGLTESDTGFLEMGKAITEIPVRSLPAARNSQPYRNRRACAGNTNCIPICPIQAKYDPTVTLNDARNTGFVTLMKRTVADEIVIGENGRVTQINFRQYRVDYGPETERGCIKAKIFVIAANAIETPRLLLMSKNRGRTPNGVANGSDMVGRNLMDHPYYVAWGLAPEPLYPYRGPLITSGIGDLCDGPFRSKRGAFRVDIGNEGWNFVVGGDPNVTTLDFVNGLNKTGANSAQNGEGLLGDALAKKLNDVLTRQFRIGFLVEQTPDHDNRVTLSSHLDGLGLRRPKITYNLSEYTRQGIVAAHRMKELMFKKMNVTDATAIRENDPSRFEEMIDGKSVPLNFTGAGHIMGTCRMGDDPRTSVIDKYQRSHEHKNLFIVGSSTFPTGATANPTLTLSALALWAADTIKNDRVLR